MDTLLRSLQALIDDADRLRSADPERYAEFCRLWHAAERKVKDVVFDDTRDVPRNFTSLQLEQQWGAQSIVFMADLLPFIHATLRKHYRRKDHLRVLDVGAASCFGTGLLAAIHPDHFVYSRMSVEAIDYQPTWERWVRFTRPEIEYRVADLFDQPAQQWDLVVCSHMVEHVPNPRDFIDKMVEICRGFAFVYSPYAENPRIPGHESSIDEATYAGLDCELHKLRSMGWHPDRPQDECLLAVIDCREHKIDGKPAA